MRAAARTLALAALLGGPAAARVAAQEPPRTPPPPADAPRVRVRMPERGLLDVRMIPLRRARLGITVNIEPRATDSIGAFVTAVSPGGPADRAGLRSGDLVVRLGGRSVLTDPIAGARAPRKGPTPGIRLIELAARLDPNDTVAVEYRRGAARRTATLVTAPEPDLQLLVARLDSMKGLQEMARVEVIEQALAERQAELLEIAERQAELAQPYERVPTPRAAPRAMAWARLAGPLAGLEFATMNPSLSEYFGTSKGVLVTRADASAPLGLRGGDVILTVDGRAPSGPTHLARILRSYDPGETVTLDILRSRKRMTLSGVLAPPAPPASAQP